MRSAAALIISAAPSSKFRSAPASASSACGPPSSPTSAPCGACAGRSCSTSRRATRGCSHRARRQWRRQCTDNGATPTITPIPSTGACGTGTSLVNRRHRRRSARSSLAIRPSPRVSIGFGVNWNSPFGPFRIDIARALLHQRGRRHEALHFQRRDRILMNKYLFSLGARRACARRSGRRSRAAAAARGHRRRQYRCDHRRHPSSPACTPCAAANAQIQAQVAQLQQRAAAAAEPAPGRRAATAGRGQTRCRRASSPTPRFGPDPDFPGVATEQQYRDRQPPRSDPAQHRLCAPAGTASAAAGSSATIMQQRGADDARLTARGAGDLAGDRRHREVLAIMNQNSTPLNVNAPRPGAGRRRRRSRRPRRRRRRRDRARRAADARKAAGRRRPAARSTCGG